MGVPAAVMVVVSVVMAAGVAAAPQDGITLTTGYQGVTVAISDQLDPNQCDQYIDSIKTMVTSASSLLFTATGEKVFFGDVVIAVPQQWVCQGNPSQSTQLEYTWDSAHLRVGPSHQLFGDNPWTQQPGGCGEPGDWIYVSDAFLLGNSDAGSPGNVLVHEWAKFRWGVFEEYGHLHDAIFPQVYLDDNNTATPTYCTDRQLPGVMDCPPDTEATEADCQFSPELTPNITVTSSLLAAPFLDSVTNFCDASTHNAAAPTKHNLLCDQRSVKDVMAQHADMSGNSPISWENTNFTVVRAEPGWPRTVLLLEYTTEMGNDLDGNWVVGRWEQLRDNVGQFIMEEAAAESYLGVVTFGSEIKASTMLPLDDNKNRVNLANSILVDSPGPDSGSKDLGEAIQRGVQVLGPKGGTLVLLTQNVKEYTLPPNENLVESAENNPVWPILYPSDPLVPTQVYEQLAAISPDTSVLTVQNDVITGTDYIFQSIDASAGIHDSLLTAAGSSAALVASGNCQEASCAIPLQVKNTGYTTPAYVKVFKSQLNLAKISVADPSGGTVNIANETNCVIMYSISTLQNGEYEVSITKSVTTTKVIAELWATPAPAPFNLEVSAWSPKGLHDLPYSKGSAPRLLATVTKDASSLVLFADVTAEVANKNTAGPTVNITLNDSGTGADVTGKDGVYSGYLVGFKPMDDVSIILTVTDNNGQAKMENTTTLRAAPTTPGNVACCGSQLDLSSLELTTIGSFAFSSSAVSGRFTGVPPETLPPGRVTDLQAERSGLDVTVSFTAPGAQLDQGQAEWYAVNCQGVDVDPSTIGNFSGMPAGSAVQDQVTLPSCNKVYTLTVVAYYDGVYGSASNAVREMAPCGSSNNNNLSGGAIAGITIGCILGVLLIVLLVYLCLNRDHLDDLWVWRMLTCRCCPCCKDTKDDEDLYSPPSRARRSDVIRDRTGPTQPIRSLADLYSKPKVEVKKDQRQTKPQDEDDGGFGERMKRQDKLQMKSVDVESLASSNSTLPINQVGLPVGGDNHAYDDGPYTLYRTAPPVPAQRRANTQV